MTIDFPRQPSQISPVEKMTIDFPRYPSQISPVEKMTIDFPRYPSQISPVEKMTIDFPRYPSQISPVEKMTIDFPKYPSQINRTEKIKFDLQPYPGQKGPKDINLNIKPYPFIPDSQFYSDKDTRNVPLDQLLRRRPANFETQNQSKTQNEFESLMNSLIMDQNSKLADTQFDQNKSSLKEGLVNAKPKKDAMNIFNSKKVVAEYQRKPIHKFSTQRNEGNEMIIEDANSYQSAKQDTSNEKRLQYQQKLSKLNQPYQEAENANNTPYRIQEFM